jgi:hypothetical protein
MIDLFAIPVWLRLSGALAAAALAWTAVWLVERDPTPAAAPPTAPAAMEATRTITLRCTAGRPVARWRVALDGTAVAGNAGDQAWSGSLAIPVSRCELVVEADPGRGGPTALRVQVDGAGSVLERTAWADGAASVTLLLPAVKR